MQKNTKMTLFSYLAYYDFYALKNETLEQNMADMLDSVKVELAFSKVCWGPAASFGDQTVSTALMYAVKNIRFSLIPEYTLVIRGTNPVSLWSWLNQDFDVGSLVPWSAQAPNTKAVNASISKATDTALTLHRSLLSNKQTFIDWLVTAIDQSLFKKITLNVTGHSLGGLLSTAFALWLSEELNSRGLRKNVTFNIYAYAGPTAGNEEYSNHLDATFKGRYINYRNPLDLAPIVWVEKDMRKKLPEIYDPIHMNVLEKIAYEAFCVKALNKHYAQLGNGAEVYSTVKIDNFPNEYVLEAAWQHVVPYLKNIWGDANVRVSLIVIQLVLDFIERLASIDFCGKQQLVKGTDREQFIAAVHNELPGK